MNKHRNHLTSLLATLALVATIGGGVWATPLGPYIMGVLESPGKVEKLASTQDTILAGNLAREARDQERETQRRLHEQQAEASRLDIIKRLDALDATMNLTSADVADIKRMLQNRNSAPVRTATAQP